MPDTNARERTHLVERWLQDQQQWQRTVFAYLDSMTKNDDFLVHLGNAMRGSLLAGKPYPDRAATGRGRRDRACRRRRRKRADERLDKVLFALHQLQGPGAGRADDPRRDARPPARRSSRRGHAALKPPTAARQRQEAARARSAPRPVAAKDRKRRAAIVTDPGPERELEAMLALSERSRAKLDRLHEVLTSAGHYGTGATPVDRRLSRKQASSAAARGRVGRSRSAVRRCCSSRRPSAATSSSTCCRGGRLPAMSPTAGFDVYIVDFGTALATRIGSATWSTTSRAWSAAACARCSALSGQPTINLVGYCLGGTLSLLYTALHPSIGVATGPSHHDDRRRRQGRHRAGSRIGWDWRASPMTTRGWCRRPRSKAGSRCSRQAPTA